MGKIKEIRERWAPLTAESVNPELNYNWGDSFATIVDEKGQTIDYLLVESTISQSPRDIRALLDRIKELETEVQYWKDRQI